MSVCDGQLLETPELTVTLSGSPSPLVMGGAAVDVGTWWNALTLPAWAMRYDYAPPSTLIPGQILLGAVPDASAVALGVVVRGSSLTDVEVRKAQLESYLAQWHYTITVTATPDEPGADPVVVGGPWQAQPTIPVWWPQGITPLAVGTLAVVGTVSIPVNPAGGL
jgi:hypothetical protein